MKLCSIVGHVPHSPGRRPEIQIGCAWGNIGWLSGLSRLTTRKWYVTVPTFFPPLSYRPTSTLQVDRFQSFSLVIRHVISAQLSARLGSVTLGRRRRSLEGDLDISTHRLEISGKVARPPFFLRKVARRRERGRTDGRTDAPFLLLLLLFF